MLHCNLFSGDGEFTHMNPAGVRNGVNYSRHRQCDSGVAHAPYI